MTHSGELPQKHKSMGELVKMHYCLTHRTLFKRILRYGGHIISFKVGYLGIVLVQGV